MGAPEREGEGGKSYPTRFTGSQPGRRKSVVECGGGRWPMVPLSWSTQRHRRPRLPKERSSVPTTPPQCLQDCSPHNTSSGLHFSVCVFLNLWLVFLFSVYDNFNFFVFLDDLFFLCWLKWSSNGFIVLWMDYFSWRSTVGHLKMDVFDP